MLTFQRGPDAVRDRERLQKLHAYLTQYPGHDRFCFIIRGGDAPPARIDYPKLPIEITEDSLQFARRLLGEQNVRIEEYPPDA